MSALEMRNFNPSHGLSHGLKGLVLNKPWAFLSTALALFSWKQFAPPLEATLLTTSMEWSGFALLLFPCALPLGYTHLHERLFGQLWCLKCNSTFQVGGDGISKSVPETRGALQSLPSSSHCQVPPAEGASRTERAGRPHCEEKETKELTGGIKGRTGRHSSHRREDSSVGFRILDLTEASKRYFGGRCKDSGRRIITPHHKLLSDSGRPAYQLRQI